MVATSWELKLRASGIRMNIAIFRPLAVIAAVAFAASAAAAPLASPQAKPILTVSGKIANTNDGPVARFDRQMLEALGTVTLRTMTPWYDHVVEFEGVSMKALMQHVGAEGTQVTATALNDYRGTIPLSDFDSFEVILAMKRDGGHADPRQGPALLVYPYDSDPELANGLYYSRSVWQVKELEVH